MTEIILEAFNRIKNSLPVKNDYIIAIENDRILYSNNKIITNPYFPMSELSINDRVSRFQIFYTVDDLINKRTIKAHFIHNNDNRKYVIANNDNLIIEIRDLELSRYLRKI